MGSTHTIFDLSTVYERYAGDKNFTYGLQSTLVISKSKGPSKTRRDIRTSTYQSSSIEEKTT